MMMLTIDPATAATFVTVLLASAGGMFRLGKLSSRVDRLERNVQQILTILQQQHGQPPVTRQG